MLDRRSGYEYEDLLACARGELFGPGNAQLPLPPMLMFDRITEISETGGEFGKGVIRAELDVKSDLWFFGCHFKNDPVMPGCLGLDAMWQMVGFYLGWVGGEGRGRRRASPRIHNRCADRAWFEPCQNPDVRHPGRTVRVSRNPTPVRPIWPLTAQVGTLQQRAFPITIRGQRKFALSITGDGGGKAGARGN